MTSSQHSGPQPPAPGLARGPLLPVLAALVLLPLGACLLALKSGGSPQTPADARSVEREGIRIVRLSGAPQEIGEQMGESFRDEIQRLVPAMLKAFGVGPEQRAAARLIEPQIPADYREELLACAKAAEVDYEDLLVANLVVDAFCSVVVAPPSGPRPLRVARNLDFHPAALLGKASVVLVVAPTGKRPFVSVGWPGFNSVTSGFNDLGLSTFVLINFGSPEVQLATPIGYRQRQVLEEAHDLESGAERFQASPVASGHYVVLADASTSCTLYRDPKGEGFRRAEPLPGGVLLCSNGAPDPESGRAEDARTRALSAFLAERDLADRSTLRDALGVSYLESLNVQAMLVEPASGRLDLALGSTLAPAALQTWVALDLAPALRGEPLDALTCERIPPPGEVRHFTQGE